MLASRFPVDSTGANLAAALDLLNHNATTRFIMFASPMSEKTADYSRSDGPTSNLPLLAALVEFQIPHAGPVYVVMDGLFLTAARQPRYSEVCSLLDAAEKSPKAFFSGVRAPFTSALSPLDAAEKLLSVVPVVAFTPSSRERFFALLSNLPESSFA